MITDNVVSRTEFFSEINNLKTELRSEIKQLDIRAALETQKMVNRFGAIVVSSVSALGVFQGVLFWTITK